MRKSMLVLAALAIVCACKKNETAAPSTTTQSTTMTTSTTAAPPPAQPATQTTASAAAPTTGVIASADGEKAGTHIDITELKRTSGGTLNLKLVLSNNGSDKLSVYGDWLGDSQVSRNSYRDISGIHLLDPVNKKKYFVVTDAEKSCVCSKNIEDVAAGGKTSLWAKFPAPPPEVTKVTIEIPHFQPIDDVPISQ